MVSTRVALVLVLIGVVGCGDNQRLSSDGPVRAVCGDGVAQDSEPCDGTDLRAQSCIGLGFPAGTLACTASCTHDTRGCTGCGDGSVQPGEQCDGAALGGATWAQSNAGLPAGAEVYKIAIDCFATTTATRCADHNLLYAATSAGLYASTSAGARWALAGLAGKIVRGVTLDPDHTVGVAPRIFVAVDDAVAIYQKP